MTGFDGLPRPICAMPKLNRTSLKPVRLYVQTKAYQVRLHTDSPSLELKLATGDAALLDA